MAVGPQQVQGVCDTAGELLAEVVLPDAAGSRQEWAAAAAAAQHVINAATAVQDACIVRLAAIEPEALDDGTWTERHKARGYVALDSPAILSGALNVTATHAERRVVAAVALAADGPAGTTTHTGLGGLHDAMRAGTLDAYRAGVVVDELQLAPPEVRDALITALEPWFDTDDGPHLRRRTRSHLARICPDLLRQNAVKAREDSGLRRWVDQPGIDRWEGTFPSEEAAQAWAAIDALAQQYREDGTCPTIERARAKALTDLVAGNSTVEYVITLTVPATLTDTGSAATDLTVELPATRSDEGQRVAAPDPGDLVEVGGLRPGDKALVARGWLDAVLAGEPGSTTLATCHPDTGALLHCQHPPGRRHLPSASIETAYRPSQRVIALVKARDGRCRFPGCTIAARFCDLDHVRPWPAGPTHPSNLICLCRRHHRTKQRQGWRVTLHTDATTTWTDPTARRRTTQPRDALHTLVLPTPGDLAPEHSTPTTRPRPVIPDGPHSLVEFLLEHLTAGQPPAPCRTRAGRRPVEAGPPRGAASLISVAIPQHHRPHATRHDDVPPF